MEDHAMTMHDHHDHHNMAMVDNVMHGDTMVMVTADESVMATTDAFCKGEMGMVM